MPHLDEMGGGPRDLELIRHAIDGPVTIVPTRHGDARGWFCELFRDDWFRANVADIAFVQDNSSMSAATGTIRGLHFQTPPAGQGKLIRCLSGAVLDVAVDLRTGSPSYGRHTAVELTPENGAWLWIPEGFAHGFETLKPDTVVLYKVTGFYSREHDKGIAFDDPDLGIAWRTDPAAATVSPKDRAQPRLADFVSPFRHQPAV